MFSALKTAWQSHQTKRAIKKWMKAIQAAAKKGA